MFKFSFKIKFSSLIENVVSVTSTPVSSFNNIVVAVEIVTDVEGTTTTYYGFKTRTSFKYGVFEMYIILDSEGKIVKYEANPFILGTEHYDYHVTMPEGYFTNFVGKDSTSLELDSVMVAGATYSSNIVKSSFANAFAAFAEINLVEGSAE